MFMQMKFKSLLSQQASIRAFLLVAGALFLALIAASFFIISKVGFEDKEVGLQDGSIRARLDIMNSIANELTVDKCKDLDKKNEAKIFIVAEAGQMRLIKSTDNRTARFCYD